MNAIDAIAAAGATFRSQGVAAQVTNAATDAATADNTFFNAVAAGLDGVQADSQRAADALTSLATHPDMATHDVILAMEQARLSLQLAAEVRQRLLDAYKEITGMQV